MSSYLADLPPRSAGRCTLPALTTCCQDDFKFGRSTTLVLTSDSKDESNMAELLLDLLQIYPSGTDILWSRWVQIWQIYPYICWQIHPPGTDISCSKWFQIWQIYPWYWHLVVKMSSNLADLTPTSASSSNIPVLTSCGQDDFKFGRSTPLVLTSCGQDQFKFGRSTLDLLADLPPWYWHLMVKMSSNLAIYPTSTGSSNSQYWHLVVKMSSNLAYLPLDLLTDQFPPSSDISWAKWVQIWQIYP